MLSTPPTVPLPLKPDKDGVIRVGGTRVPLETVIHSFNRGSTPEQIVLSFPVLQLTDVYTVIAYYLQNQDEVNAYVRQAEEDSARIRREVEARQPDMVGIRERLLARLEDQKKRKS